MGLQTATHQELTLLGVIGPDTAEERELHNTFADTRERGEWFRESPQLLKWIEQNAVPLGSFAQIYERRVGDPSLAAANALVRRLAFPTLAGDTKISQVNRVLSRLPERWSKNRVLSIWICDARLRITLQDMRDLEAAVAAHEGAQKATPQDALAQALERIANLELLVSQLQTEVYGRKRVA